MFNIGLLTFYEILLSKSIDINYMQYKVMYGLWSDTGAV